MALKSADAAAPAALGAQAQFARRYGLASSSAAGRTDNYPNTAQPSSTQSQFVGGKNFFQNGSQWVDTAVQKMANVTPLRIQFGSIEYFDLLARNPVMAPWLALGPNVQFVLHNQVYEIHE
jgi:hypothetical protein